MIVYHGTTLIVNNPYANYSQRYLDFGVGFYVTADKKQAENWAISQILIDHDLNFDSSYEVK